MTTRRILIQLTIGLLLSLKISGQSIHVHNIYFPNNETDINKKNSETLDGFLDSIDVSNNCKISVIGFADNVGDEKLNYSLSEKRALSVNNYLLSKDIPADNITAKASGPVLDPNKNKNDNDRQFNRRVEVKVSCSSDKKEDIKTIISSKPNFENDTVIKGIGGTEIKIKKGAFYPRKIKDVVIEIKELSTYCDSIPDDLETVTENGVCLASGGMAFISATYKRKPVRKSFEGAFEVKVPIQKNDTTMDFYIAVKQKSGKLRWKKADGKVVTENGKKYYTYETNVLGAFNCDKEIPGCNVDNKNVIIVKTWVKDARLKFYLKDKFSFYNARPISRKRFVIPATLSPTDIYIESYGFKMAVGHYGIYETKQIYTLSDLKYNSRKKQYKLRAKNYKPKNIFGRQSQIKRLMGCN